MSIKLEKQKNLSGDPALADQGFGRVASEPPPMFDPGHELDAACEFFTDNGYLILSNCLNEKEITHLNEFFDRTQTELPERWGLVAKQKPHHRGQGLIYSQPLLDYPELDPYTQHPGSYPVVEKILGGADKVRFSEFNFREAPENAGLGTMNFHHDAVTGDRLLRKPYMPVDWLCRIHYLTDVTARTPAFCVVPKSNRYGTLLEAFEDLGDEYQEVPIYGPAGTCVLYDTATFHTRYDGDGIQGGRTSGDAPGPKNKAVLLPLEYCSVRVGGFRVRCRGQGIHAPRRTIERTIKRTRKP
jgi:hypothetical protein